MNKQRIIGALLAVCMMVSMLSTGVLAAESGDFSDVDPNSWYYEYVSYVSDEYREYMVGYPDGTFRPSATMTRGMVAMLVANIAGASDMLDNSVETAFSDVPADKWYTGCIDWAHSEGLVSGYPDGSFKPNQEITRQEMCVLLDNFLAWNDEICAIQLPAVSFNDYFSDAGSIMDYALNSCKKFYEYGLITGYSESDGSFSFRPQASASRAEIATLIFRLIDSSTDDYICEAVKKTLAAVNLCAGYASQSKNSITVDPIFFNSDYSQDFRQQTLSGSLRVNDNLIEKLVLAAITYVVGVLGPDSSDTEEEITEIIDEISDVIRSETGLEVSDESIKEIAEQIYYKLCKIDSGIIDYICDNYGEYYTGDITISCGNSSVIIAVSDSASIAGGRREAITTLGAALASKMIGSVTESSETIGRFDTSGQLTLSFSGNELNGYNYITDAYPYIYPIDIKLCLNSSVTIGGIEWPYDTEELVLNNANIEELASALPYLPKLKSVVFTGNAPENDAIYELVCAYPDVSFDWDFEIMGVSVNSLDKKIYLNDIPMETVQPVEDSLKYFYQLEWVEMCGCGISSEEMDALFKRHPETRFVWTVNIGKGVARTDITGYIPYNFGYADGSLMYEPAFKELKYCIDLVALDLGHMRVEDYSFLQYMPKLKYLLLGDTAGSDFSYIADLENLVFLEVFLTDFSDEDVYYLLELENLEDLNLSFSDVRTPGALTQMTWLKRLWLPGTGMDSIEQNVLNTALPDTIILYSSTGSTTHGWRQSPNYFAMRDALNMFYMS